MLNLDGNFWTGVASGLAVGIGTYLFRRVIGKVPNMLAALVPHRTVRGKWRTKFYENDCKEPHYEAATVYQVLHWLWGSISYCEKHRRYDFRGTLREDIMVATYEVKGAPSTKDRGSFTLKLRPDGKDLVGCYAWTDDETDKPKGNKYLWERV